MKRIDWRDTPLQEFWSKTETHEDGTCSLHMYPHGDEEGPNFMAKVAATMEHFYERLLADEEEINRCESKGEVPLIRNGQRTHEPLDKLTLRDLSAIAETFTVLGQEKKARKQEEAERKAAEARRRKNALARERRKRKKLGEYNA